MSAIMRRQNRRKRKAFAPSASSEEDARPEISESKVDAQETPGDSIHDDDDDKPLFPKGVPLVPVNFTSDATIPCKYMGGRAIINEVGELLITEDINGWWKTLLLNGRYLNVKCTREEYQRAYGQTSFDEDDNDSEPEPDGPLGMKLYLEETLSDMEAPARFMLWGAVQRARASRLALHQPLGNEKIFITSAPLRQGKFQFSSTLITV
jgi:hypothetical protein